MRINLPSQSRRFTIIPFIPILCAALFVPSLSAQSKYALVIGNSRYLSLPALKNPGNDADDIGAKLEEAGFNVTVLKDAGYQRMEEAIAAFARALGAVKSALGLFFFAGHGVQSGGSNYLIPSDVTIEEESFIKYRAVDMDMVTESLSGAGNFLNVFILDACRDNPFSWKRSAGSRGLAVSARQPGGSIIVYATSAGMAAADGEGRNGLFTSNFLKYIDSSGLEIQEVLRLTGASVQQASEGRQVPAIYTQFFGKAYLVGGLGKPESPLGGGGVVDEVVRYPIIPLVGQRIVAISAGEDHLLLLDTEGSVWACGQNEVGQLGNASATSQIRPVLVEGLEPAVSVIAGKQYSVAVLRDGGVRHWGYFNFAQTDSGYHPETAEKAPVRIEGLSDIAAVDVASDGSLALTRHGKVYFWGKQEEIWPPLEIRDLGEISHVAAGKDVSALVKKDTTCWLYAAGAKPAQIQYWFDIRGLRDLVAVSSGMDKDFHSFFLGLRRDRTVVAWGTNDFGQLGNGSIRAFSGAYGNQRPSRVKNIADIVAVSAGNTHSLALAADGTVWAWGDNNFGQLGNGTSDKSPVPVKVADLGGIVAVSAGSFASFALGKDGTVWFWGKPLTRNSVSYVSKPTALF